MSQRTSEINPFLVQQCTEPSHLALLTITQMDKHPPLPCWLLNTWYFILGSLGQPNRKAWSFSCAAFWKFLFRSQKCWWTVFGHDFWRNILLSMEATVWKTANQTKSELNRKTNLLICSESLGKERKRENLSISRPGGCELALTYAG